MIDLKRNSKKEIVKATGVRSRESSSYTPNQTSDFKISRGRFSNFLICRRFFYLDRVMGLAPPATPQVEHSMKRLIYYFKKSLTSIESLR